ncbi:hypothetical protein PFICI_01731 [Pestalotiopsis fici W106-1]|uniref:Zn(2)-C6 fungal-type domain-containing protein n=1 Tax=Pestalotiopsis fici (strain W106-1 / CGMCC3.15140) TaxID=1229662 RepID=W3XPB9_PESFW|nr:uncharacterized protein PFICI_01731 [Pestalotiopsis fici W106-1]ETS87903.1 hypothetical protein PFICI_01731 [Pestalotiopsis fici W106-1]
MGRKYHGAACRTCRRRGRKCTRELPACQSCIDKGNECEGYAFKFAGLASRGFLSGHAGVGEVRFKRNPGPRKANRTQVQQQERNEQPLPLVDPSQLPLVQDDGDDVPPSGESVMLDLSSPGPAPQDWQLVESGIRDETPQRGSITDGEVTLSASENLEDSQRRCELPNPFVGPSAAMNLFHLPVELSFVLEYHFHEAAAKLCVDNDAARNPYREYIYPLALQRPALLYACAALSSVHYSTRHKNEAFLVDALRFRGKALSRLQESMWCVDSSLDESNLATLLMLILCDLCMGGPSNFETYFTMAKSLINLRGPLRTPDNFVEQYISWMDIMSCASTSRQPVFTIEDVASLHQRNLDWSHDVVPCATDLFYIFLDIVSLHKNTQLGATDVDAQLQSLKMRILTSPPRVERGMPWFHLTEAYRFGILLYAALLFDKTQDEDEMAWLVSSIIQHAKSIPSRSGWADQLLWPLFHAGLRMSDPRQQDWLRGKLSEMQTSGGFRNVTSAQEVLEMCWRGEVSGKYADLLVKQGVGDMIVI